MLESPRFQSAGRWTIWNSPAFGLTGIGFYLATCIVGLTLVGHLLDNRFDTQPVLTLVFLVLGLLAGFYGAYQQLKELLAHIERQRGSKGRRG
ncbi:MAG: AtpZ/AtpI family protein [Dehalococcoidia bacterium]|nr:AtpZ/AtpI family protein [Dehalococcoidia bacterium]HRC62317.1 AtpZ/AtpI family protein [Dehalococcoidia bacterium]